MDGPNLDNFSLSYRWLVSITGDDSSSSSSSAAAAAASFIDIDPRMMSQRWSGGSSSISDALANADDILSGGGVLPDRLAVAEKDDCGRVLSPDSFPRGSASLDSTKVLLSLSRRYELLPDPTSASTETTSWSGISASRNLLGKYLQCFLTPLLKKMKQMRRTASASTTEEGRSRSRSRRRRRKAGLDRCRRPSRATVAAIAGEDAERSIHEAVLHCKRSNGVVSN